MDVQKHIDYMSPGVSVMELIERSNQRQDIANPIRSSENHVSLGKEPLLSDASGMTEQDYIARTNLRDCSFNMTPACIAALYRIPRGSLAHPNNSMGIFSSAQHLWDQRDLDTFFSAFAEYIEPGTHPRDKNTQGGDPRQSKLLPNGDPIMEMTLDLETAYPIVYPQRIAIWDDYDLYCPLAGIDTDVDIMDDFLDDLDDAYCSQFRPTDVLSLSYAWVETEEIRAWQTRMCTEFMKWGLQGTSVVVASGDYGVAGLGQCLGKQQHTFASLWPSSCPWVTSIGATGLHPAENILQPESAASVSNIYSTGGGFSNFDPIPDYQQAAVSAYFTQHDPGYPSYTKPSKVDLFPNNSMSHNKVSNASDEGTYNRNGRGYPDVSANGLWGITIFQGQLNPMVGTSMAAPIFASIINRINEERLAAGTSTAGFLNYVLYKHPEIPNDITKGNNSGCGTPGFSAAER